MDPFLAAKPGDKVILVAACKKSRLPLFTAAVLVMVPEVLNPLAPDIDPVTFCDAGQFTEKKCMVFKPLKFTTACQVPAVALFGNCLLMV